MNDYDRTTFHETSPQPTRRSRARRLHRDKRKGWIVAAALSVPAIGLAGCAGTSTPATAASPAPAAHGASSSSSTRGPGFGHGGSNARSGPAAGGSSGKVSSVSKSSFTLLTSAGQKVAVKETSATAYEKGTSSTSASAVTTGQPVLVLGITNGTTITATQVTVRPTGTGSAPSWAGKVVPFRRGATSKSKQAGKIPAGYSQGSGTIVSGTAANKATKAALAVYPGGVVDRVVKLSNGEYEVHNIGVNWPHHIFVSQNFKVVGAN
ncbi:MAG: DUF5666 domain-containing protein [Solirubrobacteraceae bacterium]